MCRYNGGGMGEVQGCARVGGEGQGEMMERIRVANVHNRSYPHFLAHPLPFLSLNILSFSHQKAYEEVSKNSTGSLSDFPSSPLGVVHLPLGWLHWHQGWGIGSGTAFHELHAGDKGQAGSTISGLVIRYRTGSMHLLFLLS